MRIGRAVSSIAAVSRNNYGTAFTFADTKLLSRYTQPFLNDYLQTPRARNTRGTALSMIFDKLFSSLGGGGAFNAKIDYSLLSYPCTDLVNAAKDGKSLVELERNNKKYNIATFAGGCFWGLELAFQRVPGVEYTAVGYQQGAESSPTYDQVCAGATGHTETVCVLYDPEECSYENLLDTFFDRVNPLTVK